MEQRTHILHLNSDTATKYSSKPHDFTVVLSEELTLEPVGEWYCMLKQSYLGFKVAYPLYLCCSVCSETLAGDRRLPVLRVVQKKEVSTYQDCLYLPVRVRDLDEIRLYCLRTKDYRFPSYKSDRAREPTATHVTLEFRRITDQSPCVSIP